MKKLIICALALGGFAASAQAADLSVSSMKDPLPDEFKFAGVTAYGTIDIGGAYQEYGSGYSPYWGNALNYQPKPKELSSVNMQKGMFTGVNNAMSQSVLGVKIEQRLGQGFVFVGKAETGFNPLSMELANGAKSLQRQAQQKAWSAGYQYDSAADSGRNGQFLNGDAYAGFSNASYGTLTFGRQGALAGGLISGYDPNKGATAFSMIGNSGTLVAGSGATETSRWDQSIKYVYQFGPAHAGVMYAPGGNHTQILDWGVGANIGASYKGVSVDGYYTNVKGAVNLDSALAGAGGMFQNAFKYTVSNNEAWGVGAKYAFEVGGGFKDEPGAKVTLFAGYVNVTSTNPDKDQSAYAGMMTSGEWQLNTNSLAKAYVTDRVIQTGWLGAAYENGPWTVTGTWYRTNQNTFATSGAANKGGDLDWVSGVVDYKINKHFDVYSGVTWNGFSGDWTKTCGAGSDACSVTDNVSVASGVRFKF